MHARAAARCVAAHAAQLACRQVAALHPTTPETAPQAFPAHCTLPLPHSRLLATRLFFPTAGKTTCSVFRMWARWLAAWQQGMTHNQVFITQSATLQDQVCLLHPHLCIDDLQVGRSGGKAVRSARGMMQDQPVRRVHAAFAA